MKLHHTKYKKNYINYILSTIEEDEHGKPLFKDKDKLDYIFKRYYQEYGWSIVRVGKLNAMADWLSGLALNIEYYHDGIVELAIKMGSIDENPSEKLKDKVIENYWKFMANIILIHEPTHIITKEERILYYGNEFDCFSRLLDIQGNSTHHAIKYEGYDIEKNYSSYNVN